MGFVKVLGTGRLFLAEGISVTEQILAGRARTLGLQQSNVIVRQVFPSG